PLIISPIFKIINRKLDNVRVDTACQIVPKRISCETAQAVDWVLIETQFVKDSEAASVILSKQKFLKEIGEHIGPPDFKAGIAIRSGGTTKLISRMRNSD